MIVTACGAVDRPIQRQEISGLARFEYRAPAPAMRGVIVAAPHAGSAVGSASQARMISDRIGAGFVAAYGFKSRQISVARPLLRKGLPRSPGDDRAKQGSVFGEFMKIIREICGSEIELYIDFRNQSLKGGLDRVQVVSSGLTFEELAFIKQAYAQIENRFIESHGIQPTPMLISPLDNTAHDLSGIRHHGVLLIAERGLSLRLPEKVLSGVTGRLYAIIFSQWISEIMHMVQVNPRGLQQVAMKIMELGRLDLLFGSGKTRGIVIGSPHGTYDEYTAEVVQRISYETGLPALISRGFTPTETGGWRINVNRPSEKTFVAPEFELNSLRSMQVYQAYKDLVFKAAKGNLALYIDVHQYGGQIIQVASMGVSIEDAARIKKTYFKIRNRHLLDNPDIDVVDLLIEPLDPVEIGALAAKATGILSVAKKSLHFELPLHSLLRAQKAGMSILQFL